MTTAAIASWFLIDGFQSGRSFASKHDNQRVSHPRAFWTSQLVLAVILLSAIYGLFKTFDGMGR